MPKIQRRIGKYGHENGGNVMAKGKECTIIFNTKWGYCMQPVKCKSIAEALRLAHEEQMAFRIFVDGKFYKSGWYTD